MLAWGYVLRRELGRKLRFSTQGDGCRMAGKTDLSELVAFLEAGSPPAPEAGFLGVDVPPEQAALVLLPVPWEVTVSYRRGTADAPDAIRAASHQLDVEDMAFDRPYRGGIALLPTDPEIKALNDRTRRDAEAVIDAVERGQQAGDALARVNRAGEELNHWVRHHALDQLAAGRSVGLVGGDHSCPYGLLQALSRHYPEGFGILHVDAHHDLRDAYEGFKWSHASILFNVLEDISQVENLIQVGVRDFSRAERLYAEQHACRVRCHYAGDLFRQQAAGASFEELVGRILQGLPQDVYISFDIDGLDPAYCPSTGTPVPGGLSYAQAVYLLEELAFSGRRIIGFDLCEVAPGPAGDEWDASVGARILYKLCACLLYSRGFC